MVAAKKLVWITAALSASLALWEGGLALMLFVPRFSKPFLPVMRHVYLDSIWFTHFKPGIGRYDPELGYTLKPGTHVFSTPEYSMRLSVNRLGLRDDEASLDAPEIVVLGDSVAMGAGVQQDECFPQVLERESGRRVLNAAVSSYGTVRELRMLRRLDLSRLRAVVIQYSDNDYDENREFYRHRNTYLPMSLENYQYNVDLGAAWARYYPGKYVGRALWFALVPESKVFYPVFEGARNSQAVEYFLNALSARGAAGLSRVHVIVFEVGRWGQDRSSRFVEILNQKKSEPRWPSWFRNLTAVDLSPQLTPDRFFTLDDHPNAEGHRAIAQALLGLVGGPARRSLP